MIELIPTLSGVPYCNLFWFLVKLVVFNGNFSPIDMGKEIGERLQYHMEQAGKPFCKVIPLKAEPCISDFWSH